MDYLRAVQRVNELNIKAYAQPLSWIVDPQSDCIHTSDNCDELSANGTFEHKLTLKRALTDHRLCTKCGDYGDLDTDDRAGILETADALMDVEYKIPRRRQCERESQRRQFLPPGIRLETPNLETLQDNFENEDLLNIIADTVYTDADIAEWKTRLIVEIKNSDPVIGDTVQLRAEILHKAATEVLRKELYDTNHDPVLICQEEIIAVFGKITATTIDYSGDLNTERHPVTDVLAAWFGLLEYGMQPAEAEREMRTKKRYIAGYGHKNERALLKRLLADWKTRMDGLTAEMPPILLCAAHPSWVDRKRRYGDGSGSRAARIHAIIVTALNWVHGTSSSAVMCHPTLAEYVTSCGTTRGFAGAAYAPPIHLTEPLADEDVRNMLNLWSPDDTTSVYHTVEEALKAAKLL